MSEEKSRMTEGISLKFGGLKTAHRTKRVKVNDEDEMPEQQFVTGFAEGGALIKDGESTSVVIEGATKRVIPTQGNNFRGMGPKAYNPKRFLPEQGDVQQNGQGEDHFQLAEAEAAAPVQYGLTTMGRNRDREGTAEGSTRDRSEATASEAFLEGRENAKRQKVLNSGKDWETEAFQKDVESLPDTATLEEYAAMPVEAFGEAMLRGMGWSEDKEVKKEQAKEFVRRAPLLGLGATSAPQTHKEKRFIRPGESREAKKDLVVYDEKGNIKHTRTASDKLVERKVKGPAVGKVMKLIKGRHAGLRCKVITLNAQVEGRSQTALVRLHPSEESLTVRLKELGELEGRAERAEKVAETQGAERDTRGNRDAEGNGLPEGKPKIYQVERETNGNGLAGSERPWLMPHIRVKIISKRKGNGKLYLKKGEIIDVMAPTLCSIRLDSGGRTDASQEELETVLPRKEGARVLAVAGKYRGQRAKLLQRDGERSQAIIQLTEDLSVREASFDEIAEFVGDYGEEE